MGYYIAKWVIALFYHTFYNITVVDAHKLPEKGGAIFCANHIHFADPMVLGVALKRKIHFMGKKELFSNPLFVFVLKQIAVFPVDRQNVSLATLKEAVSILKSGEVMGIFAQSTRSAEIDEKSAKSGVALFALKAGVPVIPIGIKANYKLFTPITITVGDPMEFKEYEGKKIRSEGLQEITEQIMTEVKMLAE